MATNRLFGLLIFICFFKTGIGQDYRFGFLVEFTDKHGTEYQYSHPQEFLSERAIQRREKYHITISEEDFPVNKKYCDSLLYLNSKLQVTSRWFNSAVFMTNNESFATQAKLVSFVKKVTKVFGPLTHKNGKIQSKWDNEYNENQSFINYGASQNQITMCNAHLLHQQGFLGKGIQIAVIDAGFYKVNQFDGFDSLFYNRRILGTQDFVSGDSLVYEDHTHGMNVLSILGGNLPGQLLGSAPEASYWLLRSENVDSEFPIEEENWIAAAEFADSAGVDIITSSLGYNQYDDPTMSYSYLNMDGRTTRVTRGAEKAFSKGIFVVNSAGNSRNNPWFYLIAPSDGKHVLSIGAVDSLKNLAYFSSSGPSSDGRVKPDVVAQGAPTTIILSDGSVGKGSGTSFSCPLVAGMVACLWQSLPQLSNLELLNLIRQTATNAVSPNNDFGYGVPDFSKAFSIVMNKKDEIVYAYPNPFNDNLKIETYFYQTQVVDITLTDIKGTIVFKETRLAVITYNIYEINGLGTLERGIYILTVTSKNKQSTRLIVKST